ncbi:MAG: hypothetical protein COV91_01505 [Candidatus Taylorbacteria bacterium CG11_big_fil_rev_8_21_14_0_20_46_11]|uniref:Helicase ATP-binding domain-containing protein n=1 Tax=Candidatus Taylorbacteria bacterium CG11_big_fil_rev_8_21_14_0_20_46_11 TaxID=1975025 RepID=A0A2H0KCH3_9BACT|nr:MAG: hypothetical protein COV91_01505 [Candidatus Taylorbacteria bacterium CG11_big_fil_rev_8_21_14_0_20_46_11]
MTFELTKYQDEAVREILEYAKKLLRQTGEKKLMFRSPTGSGKTIIMAEFLARFADDTGHSPCAFIWAAPRQLHEQSKEKIEAHFEHSRAMDCSFFDDLNDRRIGENEVLFFNWESIRQNNNIVIRENEQDNNLSSVIERTREAGRKVVLVIDESHFHAQAETSKNLIAAIAPNLTIEVSATPVMENPDKIVSVDIGEIKAEGMTGKAMIKKSVVLNEDFKNVLLQRGQTEKIKSDLAGSTDDIVLREALKKREELALGYKAAGMTINPLLLIQLPDRRGQADDDRQEMITRTLKDKHGIGIENNKLAVYLSEDKQNLGNITRNDNEVEVLIFKQAIALGWDCPRAQVLVLFREWSSPVFSIQTIGRIMRMPEPERGYHDNEILNYSYVYTNLEDIEIKDDIGRGYIVLHTSKRDKKYEQISLPSVHRERHREQTRLSSIFTALFLGEAQKYGLEKKIKTKNQRVHPAFISDWKTENIDEVAGEHIRANAQLTNTASDMDLQRLFDYFIRKSLAPEFHPEDRSIGHTKRAIYQFFKKQLGMEKADKFQDIISIVLSEDNQPYFKAVIDMAKLDHIQEAKKREEKLADGLWKVPDRLPFDEEYTEIETKKSVMQPFFAKWGSDAEKRFVEFLDSPRNSVSWWFKNGDRDAIFFAVPYKKGNGLAPFYVDFVLMMKDGSIGLLDPHGIHLADFADKSDGLHEYIDHLRENGRKVFGGIIANTNHRDYSGQWMLYEGVGANAKKDDWANWTRLELS